MQSCPDWLQSEIAAGMQMLLALRLEGAPSEDVAPVTCRTWGAALMVAGHTWDRDRDIDRVRGGFLQLAATCERWPNPPQFMRAIPRIEHRQAISAPRSYEIPDSWRKLVAKITGKESR